MSVGKAHRLLGWEPKIGLDGGMALYANFYKEFLNASQDSQATAFHGHVQYAEGTCEGTGKLSAG